MKAPSQRPPPRPATPEPALREGAGPRGGGSPLPASVCLSVWAQRGNGSPVLGAGVGVTGLIVPATPSPMYRSSVLLANVSGLFVLTLCCTRLDWKRERNPQLGCASGAHVAERGEAGPWLISESPGGGRAPGCLFSLVCRRCLSASLGQNSVHTWKIKNYCVTG